MRRVRIIEKEDESRRTMDVGGEMGGSHDKEENKARTGDI